MWVDRLLGHYSFIVDPGQDPSEGEGHNTAAIGSKPLCHVDLTSHETSPKIHLNTHAGMRLMSTHFFRRGKSQIKVGEPTADSNRLDAPMRALWKQAGLPHEGRSGILKDSMRKHLFKGVKPEEVLLEPNLQSSRPQGSPQVPADRVQIYNFLEIIRRAVFLSAKSEPMQLPSYRAVELHVNRAELAFRLAIECVAGNQPSLASWKDADSGWQGQDESDIRIVWDDHVMSPSTHRAKEGGCGCGKRGNAAALCKSCACATAKRPCDPSVCGCRPDNCKNPNGRIAEDSTENRQAIAPEGLQPTLGEGRNQELEPEGADGSPDDIEFEDQEQDDDVLSWLLPEGLIPFPEGEDSATTSSDTVVDVGCPGGDNEDDFLEGVGDGDNEFGIDDSDCDLIGRMI